MTAVNKSSGAERFRRYRARWRRRLSVLRNSLGPASWSWSQPETAVVIGFLALFLLVLLRTAWVSDDAYITYRTISNFAAGEGLVWNVGERVQAYTHPLWLFLHLPLVYLTREFYFTGLALSIAVSLAAAVILSRRLGRSPMVATLGVAALVMSRAFVDYSTSGLENPLSHLLAVVYLAIYFWVKKGPGRLLALAFLAGLAGLNRLDSLLIYLPSLAYAFWQVRGSRALGSLALGFIPLILWEVFSLLYYGFLLPNTAYAKLAVNIPASELIEQGLYYLANSLSQDPLTLLIVLLGLLLPLVRRRPATIAVALGALAYLLYVVRIGGDFMSGRFLTLPFLVCLALLVRQELPDRWALTGLVLVVAVGFGSPAPPVLSGADYGADLAIAIDPWGVSDERAYYYSGTGLLHVRRHVEMPNHPWVHEGIAARGRSSPVVLTTGAGFFGFFAGRGLHLVDLVGLADPLLARIPPRPDPFWRVGHFERGIPEGYLETLASGENQIAEPHLAEYYRGLSTVVRGDLIAPGRLRAIWALNTGGQDALIEAYQQAILLTVSAGELDPGREGEERDGQGGVGIPPAGLRIVFDQVQTARRIELRIDRTSTYLAVFERGDSEVDRKLISELPGEVASQSLYTIGLSAGRAQVGYDTITIYPAQEIGGQRLYTLEVREDG